MVFPDRVAADGSGSVNKQQAKHEKSYTFIDLHPGYNRICFIPEQFENVKCCCNAKSERGRINISIGHYSDSWFHNVGKH
ncbi:hypothetical protein SDC9_52874 [bioreactor metagenome]|uniref:Uncharacterized protein n=1 Tax=bioreactor metagenome TaxID=1076179 RepID=A0A644WWZ0_9ZZZZ